MRNADRIDAYRDEDGKIVAVYECANRCSFQDFDLMFEDALEAVGDNGEHEYNMTITPECIMIKGTATPVFEIVLTSPTIKANYSEHGIGPDAQEKRALNSVRGWRI